MRLTRKVVPGRRTAVLGRLVRAVEVAVAALLQEAAVLIQEQFSKGFSMPSGNAVEAVVIVVARLGAVTADNRL